MRSIKYIYVRSKLTCLLYTSDAADDSLRVDLGGRRIIKNVYAATAHAPNHVTRE